MGTTSKVAQGVVSSGASAGRRHRGLLLAVVIAAATVAVQHGRHRSSYLDYDAFHLPAFDPNVYFAMAEHPSFFTVAPWGYRVLTPWLVRALSGQDLVSGFQRVTLGALTATGVLLFLYLRRLGFGEWPCLAAVAALGLSPPVGDVVAGVFLVEPLTLFFEVAFLLALEAGGGLGVLALLAVLGAMSKEFFLFLLPLVFLARRSHLGNLRALLATVLVALPALLVTVILWQVWVPHIPPPRALPPWQALDDLQRFLGAEGVLSFLMGLAALVLLGALRSRARAFLPGCGYLFLAALVAPFFNPMAPPEMPRLLVYALPPVMPLALLALDIVWPHLVPPADARAPRRWLQWTAGVAAASLVVVTLTVVDPYRRVDLQGRRDGTWMLGLCRESLKAAGRLDKGKPVIFNLAEHRFAPVGFDRRDLGRMRWFLRDGWGENPHYGLEAAIMAATEASLLLPCLRPAALDLTLTMTAPAEVQLRVLMNGVALGEIALGSDRRPSTLRVPASALFRGDNRLTLVLDGAGTARPQLHALAVRRIAEGERT